VKTLTIRQPWAWAVAKGIKPIENRGWTTNYRGTLAIHAAARWDDEAEEALREVVQRARTQGAVLPRTLADDFPLSSLGAVVAIADLMDICTQLDGQCDCGPWAQIGQNHWQLANVQPLSEAVPAKGRLGLWELDIDLSSLLVGGRQ